MLQEIFNLDEGPVNSFHSQAVSHRRAFKTSSPIFSFSCAKPNAEREFGDYFAETYASDGIKAKEVHYFDGCHDLKRFVDQFKERASTEFESTCLDEQR